jgi:uncharacterized protein (DUF305 family)
MRGIQRSIMSGIALFSVLLPILTVRAQIPADVHSKRPEAAPQSQRPDMAEMHDDIQQLSGLRGKDLEVTFLNMMMDHHQSGIGWREWLSRRRPVQRSSVWPARS